jgi:rubredoxin
VVKPKKVNLMDRYKCKICGYIYDPEVGDKRSGIKPGTPFEELPDDWICPSCGAPKRSFVKI